MTWYRVIRGLVTGSLISLGGGWATRAAGETVSAQTGGERGYAYICDGPAQVQEVKEYPGYEVVIVDSVERPNSPNGMFEIFQTSRPEKCAALAAPFTGAVPGTLLVAVTWATPHLSIVRPPTASHEPCTGAVSPARTEDVSTPILKL
jgi:hypothetical protein